MAEFSGDVIGKQFEDALQQGWDNAGGLGWLGAFIVGGVGAAGMAIGEFFSGGNLIQDTQTAPPPDGSPAEDYWTRETLESQSGYKAADLAGLAEAYAAITGNTITAQDISDQLWKMSMGDGSTVLETDEQLLKTMVTNGQLALKVNQMIRELRDFGAKMNAGDMDFLRDAATISRGGTVDINGVQVSDLATLERYVKKIQYGVDFQGEDPNLTDAMRTRYGTPTDQKTLGTETMALANQLFDQDRERRLASGQVDDQARQAELRLLSEWTAAKRNAEAVYVGLKSAESLKLGSIQAETAVRGWQINQERAKAESLRRAKASAAGNTFTGTLYGVAMAEAMRYDMESLFSTTIDINRDNVIQANEIAGGLRGQLDLTGDQLTIADGVTGEVASLGLPTAQGMTLSELVLAMGANAEYSGVIDQVRNQVRMLNVQLVNLAQDINLNAGPGAISGIGQDVGIENLPGGAITGDRLADFGVDAGLGAADGIYGGEIAAQVASRRAGMSAEWDKLVAAFSNQSDVFSAQQRSIAESYNPTSAPVGGAGGIFGNAALSWGAGMREADLAGMSGWEVFNSAISLVGNIASAANGIANFGKVTFG